MDILDLGLLIFILFYIFKNAYLSIALFALISLILQQFSKNKLLFVLLPLLVAHLFFLYNNPQEGFKRRWRKKRLKKSYHKFKKNPIKEIKKHANNAMKLQFEILSLKKKNKQEKQNTADAKQETKVAEKQTEIAETQKVLAQDITAQINEKADEYV